MPLSLQSSPVHCLFTLLSTHRTGSTRAGHRSHVAYIHYPIIASSPSSLAARRALHQSDREGSRILLSFRGEEAREELISMAEPATPALLRLTIQLDPDFTKRTFMIPYPQPTYRSHHRINMHTHIIILRSCTILAILLPREW
jgi:hypothetical protein